MPEDEDRVEQIETLFATPDLAGALDSTRFRRFLDRVPIAILVSDMRGEEVIIYANPEFENVTAQAVTDILGRSWGILSGRCTDEGSALELGAAIIGTGDCVGRFRIERAGDEPTTVDAYSSVIQNDDASPAYRLAALVRVCAVPEELRDELDRKLRDKDILLLEIQHRVKNNLQLLTAMMRIEAREARGRDMAPFDRLAGRIESLQLLYTLLSDPGATGEIDLGVYLSEIASSVMRAHAVEGIRLNLKVDAYPVSVNVAMPTGLVVNELLTNALKHAFVGRDGGTITLHSLSDGDGCRICVADNGVGLPPGVQWPQPGRLGALIAQSLRENAKAQLTVDSSPEHGTRVTIIFTRAASAPEATVQVATSQKREAAAR